MNSGFQVYSEQNKLAQWIQIAFQCRDSGLSVRQWCQEHGVNVSSYYKLQRKVYDAAKPRRGSRFVEVTPVQPVAVDGVAVTIRIAGVEAEIRNSADAATVEAVLQVLKPC